MLEEIEPIENNIEPAPEVIEEVVPVKRKRENLHLKSDNPKRNQVSFRLTDADNETVQRAVNSRKKNDADPYSVSDLLLDLIKEAKTNPFSYFKIK